METDKTIQSKKGSLGMLASNSFQIDLNIPPGKTKLLP
jgi:hypothetical protein